MKKFHICIIALLVTLVCTAFTPLPFYFNTNQRLAIENQKSIHFMEQEYIFGYGNEIQNEYFPKGESINSFPIRTARTEPYKAVRLGFLFSIGNVSTS